MELEGRGRVLCDGRVSGKAWPRCGTRFGHQLVRGLDIALAGSWRLEPGWASIVAPLPHPLLLSGRGRSGGGCWDVGGDWIFIFCLQGAPWEGLPVACMGQGKDRRVDFLGRRRDVGGWPWILGFCAL